MYRLVALSSCLTLHGMQAAAGSTSLLDDLLRSSPNISASLSNVAQQMGMVDGSLSLATEQNLTAMSSALELWSEGRRSASAAQEVRAIELQENTLARLEALRLDLGTVSTTAIGSLQSADIAASFNAAVVIQRLTLTANETNLTVESWGAVTGQVLMQNISTNMGHVAAATVLHIADAGARIDDITVTALGALQSGAMRGTADLSATVLGQMGKVNSASSELVRALVGS